MSGSFIDYFLLDGAQIIGLVAVLLTALGLVAIGGLVGGRNRIAEGDLIYGWALALAVYTSIGTLTDIKFSIIGLGLAAIAAAAGLILAWREKKIWSSNVWRVLLCSGFLIILIADMKPSQWDEFTNWLPNARHLFVHDGFPSITGPAHDLPAPAYPYGLPLLIYFASLIAGTLVENAGALFNLLFYLGFAGLLARVIGLAVSDGSDGGDGEAKAGVARPAFTPTGWALCALGGLAITALSPTFVPKIVFTAYAEVGTAISLGLGAVLGWLMLDALAHGDRRQAGRLAWQLSLAAIVLVSMKQGNYVLLASLYAALAFVAWRDRRVPLIEFIRLVLLALLLPIAVWALWRVYVGAHIEAGEFIIRPFSQWFFPFIGDIAARMALVASKKGGYFGVMLVAVLVMLFTMRHMRTRWHSLAAITAIVFILYNAGLLLAYISAFGEGEARRAASYWRYNMHLGGVCVVFAAYGLGLLWHRRPNWLRNAWPGRIAIILVILLPFAAATKLRFDDRPPKTYVRAVASDIRDSIEPNSRLAVIDFAHGGFYAMMMRYYVFDAADIAVILTAYQGVSARIIRKSIDESNATHAWVHIPTQEGAKAFGVQLPDRSSYFLKRQNGAWRIIRSWPYPGYRLPSDLPD